MRNTYTSGAILTIRRPDGKTEDVVNTQHARNGVIPAAVFVSMIAATQTAGRGVILSQRPNVVEVPLSVQRMEIAGKLADLAEDFPSNAKNAAERALEAELAAFDAAHPEVVAEIVAARATRTADGVARALRMED